MIFQILDRQFNTLATMDNSLTGAIHFFNDEFHQYLAEGSSTYTFSVLRNHADTQYLIEGNYLQFTYKSRDYLMTIRRIEADEYQLDITCEDLCFDLINEYTPAYTATKARKITEYLADVLVDSDVVIGRNEVASYTRKLEWTGESTVLARVLSIANYFDAEVEFVTELENDRSLKQITLNIYHKYDDKHQGVGVDRTDIELRFGENVKTVKKTTDITELYTCIKPVGKDGLSIKDIEETIKDDYGNVQYYTKKGSQYIYAPQSNDRFGRKNSEKGGYINMPYEFETTSAATLYGNALAQLKKYSEPAVTYEVEGYYDLNVGDVVSIADNGYSPMLLLEARVSEMIISFCNPEQNTTVFTNYRVFDSQISSDLLDMMEKLKDDVDYAVQVANTPILKIAVNGSTVFKNGEGTVTLQASIEKAMTDITDEYTVFNWKKNNKDGSLDEEWTAAHKNHGKVLTVTPTDFDDAAVFSYEVETEDKVLLGGAASLVKVYDGEDGKTPIKGVDYFDGVDGTDGRSAYLHIRYSQNESGSPMTEDPVDAKYVGMQVSQSPVASTDPADYDWTLVKGADGIAGETGADGRTSYLHIKYSNDGGKTFTANNGEAVGQWLGQYVDFESVDSTDVSKYAWSKIKGEDGTDGKDGVAGKDGVGLKSTAIQYAQSTSGTTAPTTGWANSVPTLVKGQHLWTKTVWTYTDNSSETGYTVSYNAKDGNNGTDGVAGKDGVGISNTVIEYVGAVSGTSKPTSGWSTTIPTVPQGQYLWTRTTWTYTDGTKEQGYSAALMGPKGDKGDTGDNGQTPVVHPAWSWSADGTDRFCDKYPPENLLLNTNFANGINYWTSTGNSRDVSTVEDSPFENRKSLIFEAKDIGWTSGILYNFPTGSDIKANKVYSFGAWLKSSTNGTVVTIESATDLKMIVTLSTEWQYFAGNMSFESDNRGLYIFRSGPNTSATDETIYINSPILAAGEDAIPNQFWALAPSEDYANAYPLYEGTYTDYSDTASQNPADYTWRRIIGESGQDGVAGADGKGIKSTAVSYQASASGTTAPTGTWVANPPTVAKGQYLWTRTIWTYTDNATETGYSVAYVAKDGNNGTDGIAGKDGVGIKSTAITYAVSSSGTTAPTSGWVASPPTAAAGQFMWTRTVWTYTDNTTETGYSVGKIGNNGATGPQGPQGITGPKGEDGKQYYTWLKYADSPTTGMSDSPTNKKYMGLAYNKTTATESTNYADYTWSLIQGPQGNQGIQGPAGANGQPTYTWIKYGTSASGAGLSDDPTGKTYIGMAYNKTTATESTNAADYTWSLIQGPKGDNGISVASVTEEYYVSTSATTQTGGSWSTTVPNNANPNLYVWRRVKNTMSDDTVSYTTPALIQGMTGIYPYIGPTQPANPKEGQQWWKSDSNGNVTDFYVYHDGSWQGQTIQQSILNIVELNAVTISGSTITGTTINGSRFVNESDYGDTGTEIHAITTVAGNISMEWKSNVGTSNGLLTIYPDFLQSDMYSDAAKTQRVGTWSLGNGGLTVGQGNPGVSTFKGAAIGPNGIGITDPRYAPTYGEVSLNYQDLMTIPPTQLVPLSGYSIYASTGGNRPTARRNGRVVTLAGAFTNTTTVNSDAGTWIDMAKLPAWAVPSQNALFVVQGSGRNMFCILVDIIGVVRWARYGPTSPFNVPAGAWLNIACVYTARDL